MLSQALCCRVWSTRRWSRPPKNSVVGFGEHGGGPCSLKVVPAPSSTVLVAMEYMEMIPALSGTVLLGIEYMEVVPALSSTVLLGIEYMEVVPTLSSTVLLVLAVYMEFVHDPQAL